MFATGKRQWPPAGFDFGSLCDLSVLCVSVSSFVIQAFITETQSPHRTHRELVQLKVLPGLGLCCSQLLRQLEYAALKSKWRNYETDDDAIPAGNQCH